MQTLSAKLVVPVRLQQKGRAARSRAPARGAVYASASSYEKSFGSAIAAVGVVAILANPFASVRAATAVGDLIEVASEKEVNKAVALENTRAKAEGRKPREVRVKGVAPGAPAPPVKAEAKKKPAAKAGASRAGASAPSTAKSALDKNEVASERKAAKDKALADVRAKALREAAVSAPAPAKGKK